MSDAIRPRLAVIVCGWCGCEPAEPCLLCQGRIDELGEYADWLVMATKGGQIELDAAYLIVAWGMHDNPKHGILAPAIRIERLIQHLKKEAEECKSEAAKMAKEQP